MLKNLLLIIFLLISFNVAKSQDKIIRTNGKEINCHINSIDSTKISLTYKSDGKDVKSFIMLSNVSSYFYNGSEVSLREIKREQISTEDNNVIEDKFYNKYAKDIEFANHVESSNRNFIYTYSGKIIPARELIFKEPFIGAPHFIVDEEKMDRDNVKFFKIGSEYYANVRDVSFMGKSVFAERISKGKVNLFEIVSTNYSGGMYNPSTGMYSGGMMSTRIDDYYNTGFNDLKKATYENLRADLASNPQSMLHLDKYQSTGKTQVTLYIVGSLAIVGGLVGILGASDEETNENPNSYTAQFIAIGAGSLCFTVSYFIGLSKPTHLFHAIEAYNR